MDIFKKSTEGMTLAELRAHNDAMLLEILRKCNDLAESSKVIVANLREAQAILASEVEDTAANATETA